MRRIKSITNLLLSKLVAVNSIVILLVIMLAGISVKDYACFLVNHEQVTGQQLVETLNSFLIKVSVIAFIAAGLLHYFSVKKIVNPVKAMAAAANQVKTGTIPSKIDVQASGELGELVTNFNAMTETLSVVQKRREEMLRDIAHELRTPLTNINGYLEALHSGVLEGDQELFGSLLEESRRITRIVDLIAELDAWSQESHFPEKQFEEIDMKQVLAESLAAFHLKLSGRFETFSQQLEHAPVLGHKDGLKQVLSNLLQNIIDYDTGGHLAIQGQREGAEYRITFSHEGTYIDPEHKELIFERFYRLEESRSTKAEGAGLGLAIAKSIMNAHQGQIGLDTDGHNHSFWIRIPLHSVS
ncbi:HAMP domain-containing histidine kinase [Bacillus sp. ISL-35]|uniref:HAMP domain-containing sensor histidine kinase n=1 Tax=Bacillus sp. ISL-35 TaxID=2819122 RepID=UPI001BE755A0|nr:ATP-binding protein [Bacillus sp. ISL-35]MBT2679128.1 HAMP domain-containing histidine kinase [Bacillus sp. ISL-35]MBT2702789.1 HAMP domain-containing histidine kinase [Chryseobacterium sp. ISL-80]